VTCADYPALAILGPTGSGKSQLALVLARRLKGEIVSCDALQIYRGMDIGTAKASAEERAGVPHHMLDLRNPDEDFSAGDYQRLAREALAGIRSRTKIPIVAGGTGFYFRALTHGLFEGPGRSEHLRARMQQIVKRGGTRRLHRALSRADPEAAGRMSPADFPRILRAYEVFLATGKPMSWWHAHGTAALEGFRWLKLALSWPRDRLYERIELRVGEMFSSGFVEEVETLIRRYPRESHAFKAIGYRQIISHLNGALSLEEAIDDTCRESRRYAKRQLTWFRADPEIRWIDAADGLDSALEKACGELRDLRMPG
jgi:tRNA dimethylallyltransferase